MSRDMFCRYCQTDQKTKSQVVEKQWGNSPQVKAHVREWRCVECNGLLHQEPV